VKDPIKWFKEIGIPRQWQVITSICSLGCCCYNIFRIDKELKMQLRIAGLSPDTVSEDLIPLFRNLAVFEFVTVIRDIISGKSKGYAIVKIPNDQAAQEAINKLNGNLVKGNRIAVSQMPETMPGEMEFREWLADNAVTVLKEIGLRAGQTILDFGCGPGIFTIPAAEIAGENGTVLALDVRSQPLERVRERAMKDGLKNIRTILLESPDLSTGLPDRSIDTILVFDMLHSVTDRQGLFLELHRVLKKNGLLSIFPMHLGTEKLLKMVNESRLFFQRDIISAPVYQSPSEVVNLAKLQKKHRK
jgi:2-polyprenyl-3-methyl-5-hydroxy-6-metoxy-1,4-benzoquinol methylase